MAPGKIGGEDVSIIPRRDGLAFSAPKGKAATGAPSAFSSEVDTGSREENTSKQ
jgi:hypothetical protein